MDEINTQMTETQEQAPWDLPEELTQAIPELAEPIADEDGTITHEVM